jgi:endoglucanase
MFKGNVEMLKGFAVMAAVAAVLTGCGGSSTDSSSSGADASASADTQSTSTVALSSTAYKAVPSSSAVVTIYRSGTSAGTAAAAYSTGNGSAVAGTDYVSTSGTVSWEDGDRTPKTVSVPISRSAMGKSLAIKLVNTQGASVGSPAAATIQIVSEASTSSSSSGSSTSSSSSSSSSSGGSSTSSSSTSSSSGSATHASSSTAFGIQVAGNKFVSTQTGNVVQLLGSSLSGLEQGATSLQNGVETYVSATDGGFKAMASWNMNVVRIPLNEDTWLGIHNCTNDGGSSATLQSNVKQIVANANAAGLYVILDLHWTAPNSFGCPVGQGSMPDADNTVAFWTSVATMFKGNNAVIFEMFNEPFATNNYGNWVASLTAAISGQTASDLNILINGGTYYNGYMYQCNNRCSLTKGQEYTASGTFQATGYQQIINAIRATGSTNVLLMNPIGWAGQIQTWLTARPTDPAGQLAVGWHEDGSNTSQASQVLAAGLPIVITEAYTMNDATYQWAVQNKVGFSYWAWVDWSGGGLLTNAKTSAPNSLGTALKASYCTQPSVNSLSACN